MRVLGIEAATGGLGVALVDERGTIAQYQVTDLRRSNVVLPTAIANMLSDAGYRLEDIDGVAVSAGPGSFTGVRIGMAFAKAFAWAKGLPIAPVLTTEAVAWGARHLAPKCLAVVDAGRGLVYAALYDVGEDDVHQASAIYHGDLAGVSHLMRSVGAELVVCGPGLRSSDLTVGRLPGMLRPGPLDCDQVSPVSVAELGAHRIAADPSRHPFSLAPAYVGRPGVTTKATGGRPDVR